MPTHRETDIDVIPRLSMDNVTGLARIELAQLPTPFEPAPRLAAAIGLREIHIKREDLSGYALGGNKLRQLDFILAEALEAEADMVITTAGSQSRVLLPNWASAVTCTFAKMEGSRSAT